MSRRKTLDTLGRESQIGQRHTFARRREEWPLFRPTQRPDPQWIAGDKHVPHGVQKNNVVGPIELLAQIPQHLHDPGVAIPLELKADRMHQDFRVVLTGEVELSPRKNLVPELGIIGQLSIEGETEPLALLDVVSLKRLGVAAVVFAASRIAHMANRGMSRILPHQLFVRLLAVEVKHLRHGPHFFVGVDQLVPLLIEGGEPGSQLATVLDVNQHSGDEATGGIRISPRDQRTDLVAEPVIDRHNATLVSQLRHLSQTPGVPRDRQTESNDSRLPTRNQPGESRNTASRAAARKYPPKFHQTPPLSPPPVPGTVPVVPRLGWKDHEDLPGPLRKGTPWWKTGAKALLTQSGRVF